MAAEYQYLVEDIMAQRIVGDLPLNDATYEDFIRRPGTLNGSLAMKDADDNVEVLDEGRFAVYAVRDGRIEQGAIMSRLQVPTGTERLSVSCLGWLHWLDRRKIRIDRQFTATDQFDIFKTLVDDAQDEGAPENGAGADVGLTVTWATLSGVLRDRTTEYRSFVGKNLGAALRELAAVENGFDFRMAYEFGGVNGDQIVKTIVLAYPQQGVDYSEQAGFEYGRPGSGFEYQRNEKSNVLRRGIDRDASRMAWRLRGWGAGQDVGRLYVDKVDETKRGVYPFYDDDAQMSSIIDPVTLDEQTGGTLETTKDTKRLPSIEVDVNLDPQWGAYWTGDTFDVSIDDGLASLSGPHRIVGFRMRAAADVPELFVQGV